jgi:hypothetical protein
LFSKRHLLLHQNNTSKDGWHVLLPQVIFRIERVRYFSI